MDEPLDFLETELSDFQKRYGKAIPDNTYITNEFIEGIIKRKTVRRFTNQKIDPALLEKLFAAAQSSPTSSMFQTWCAIVIEDKERREEIFFSDVNRIHMGLADRTIKHGGTDKNIGAADKSNYNAVMECDTFIVWCVDLNIVEEVLTNPKLNSIYPQDTVNLARDAIRHATHEVRAMCDTIVAAQTFCLAAESMGLGTMYCGSVKSMDLIESLNLPQRVMPIFGICVGYPQANLDFLGRVTEDKNKPDYTKPRMPQSLVVHKETFQKRDIIQLKKYNWLMKKFYIFYKMGGYGTDWFYRIITRSQIYENQNKFYKDLMKKYGFWFK